MLEREFLDFTQTITQRKLLEFSFYSKVSKHLGVEVTLGKELP